jgi:hypothetical protein
VTKKIIHPLWVHIPALAALVALIVYTIISLPLPAEAPVHFGTGGLPDRYGSPWEALGISIGLSVFFLLLSAFMDELWARQENSRTFNWLSLLDEIVVGAMTGINIGYLAFLNSGGTRFEFPWQWFALVCGASVLAAVILETMRPFRLYPGQVPAGENTVLKAEVADRIKSNSVFIYWDSQNPFYVSLLSTVLPLGMIITAVLTWSSQLWVSVVILVVGLLLVIPYGGQRNIVTRDALVVRWGIFGIRVLKLETSEISEAEIHDFSPLKDFGGYGIRFNREMRAYYLRGSRGVKITAIDGKKYLIGSDQPENLLSVIDSVLESR